MRHIRRSLGLDRIVVKWPTNEACPWILTDVMALDDVEMLGHFEALHFTPDVTVSHRANSWWGEYQTLAPALFPDFSTFSEVVATELQDMFRHAHALKAFEKWKADNWPDDEVIGIHLRRTDKTRPGEPLGSVGKLLEADCAIMSHVLNGEISNCYLATDSLEYSDLWTDSLERAGMNVLSCPKAFDPSKLRQTSAKAVICDILGLSHCTQILASCPSSILLLASRLNRRPQVIQLPSSETAS